MTLKPAFQKYVFPMILSKLKCFMYRSYRFVTCFLWFKPGMSCFYPSTKGWSDPKLIGHQGMHAGFHEDRNLDQWIFNGMTWGCNAQTPRNASHNQDCYIMGIWYTFRLGNPELNKPSFVPLASWDRNSQLASCQPWPRGFSVEVFMHGNEEVPLWIVCLFRMLPSVTNIY